MPCAIKIYLHIVRIQKPINLHRKVQLKRLKYHSDQQQMHCVMVYLSLFPQNAVNECFMLRGCHLFNCSMQFPQLLCLLCVLSTIGWLEPCWPLRAHGMKWYVGLIHIHYSLDFVAHALESIVNSSLNPEIDCIWPSLLYMWPPLLCTS